ncbi:COG4653 Predicted phage phi-C31 gp36 major capsid-like protein [uncultured Caudovirales phage]|uniref:COG4653 Predicted phage phi-C31 gp36 major capsid-like protein n=1 Tax=uncultured Caudovirales phage TaxID=2100421 RepID=A0A6J5RFI7_9CAUD|nr:COG4653 Predicted phage phi-C31 gp36 major capsid-like protein [uncultured Caudovirales phage]
MNINEILGKKKEANDAATELRDRVYNEQKGEWRNDDTAKFDELCARAEAFQAEVDRSVRLERNQTTSEENGQSAGRRSEPINPQRQFAGKATAADADLAVRGWLLGGNEEAGAQSQHLEAANRVGLKISAGSLNLRMAPPLRSLDPRDIEAWEKRAANGVGSGAIGLYTAPDSPMGALERAMLAFGGMRQVSTVYRTASGTDMPFPTNNDTGNKGAILAENTQVSEVDPTFGQLVLNSYKYSSKLVLIARELLQDSAVNIPELIGQILGERIGRIQNDHFTTGDNSSKPNGVVTAATSASVTTASALVISYDNLVDLVHALDPAYRMNARFMFSDAALKVIKKIKVAQYSGDTVGAPLWIPGLAGMLGDTIMGYPYTVNQSVAVPAASAKAVLFGDFSKYLIRDVSDVRLVRMEERYADYDQVGFTAFVRSDADLLDAGTHPVVYLTQGS